MCIYIRLNSSFKVIEKNDVDSDLKNLCLVGRKTINQILQCSVKHYEKFFIECVVGKRWLIWTVKLERFGDSEQLIPHIWKPFVIIWKLIKLYTWLLCALEPIKFKLCVYIYKILCILYVYIIYVNYCIYIIHV